MDPRQALPLNSQQFFNKTSQRSPVFFSVVILAIGDWIVTSARQIFVLPTLAQTD
jgi:hypothetical protein